MADDLEAPDEEGGQELAPPPHRSPAPPQWDPTTAISFGWKAVKADPSVILVLFVGGLLSYLVSVIGSGIALAVGDDGGPWIRLVAELINLPIACYIGMGILRYLLKTVRSGSGAMSDLFSGGPFLEYFAATLLLLIAYCIGIVLCIVPGIVLALGLQFTGFLIIDKDLAAVAAIKQSWRLTTGHKGMLFLFALLAFAVNLLGVLACFVGVILTSALTSVAMTWIYLRLSGEDPPVPAAHSS